jgi:hypothetical protein
MTVIVRLGSRTRALAVRLETETARQEAIQWTPPGRASTARTTARWLCTDIEAA